MFALLPAGYALGRGERGLALATAAVAFGFAMASNAPFTTPRTGFGLFALLFAAASATAVTAVGAPLLVAGTALGTSKRTALGD